MRSRLLRFIVPLLGVLLVVGAQSVARAQSDRRCFPETGFCIEGRIREFWERNGGLAVFGFPIAPQQEESIEGRPLQAQWFERRRLELHPENPRPYDVLLGRLGVDRLHQQGREWFQFPRSSAQPGCRFFPATGHNVCGDFLAAWSANGLEIDGRKSKTDAESLGLFGLPLSDAATETIDGKDYTIQWFERARFELHPENAAPYKVLFGLLGAEVRDAARQPPPPPPPPPALPAPSFNDCKEDPNAAAAPNYPVKIVTIDKVLEIVRLQNVSPEPVDLLGWRMCSIKDGQLHEGIRDVLPAGAMRDFPYAGLGSIWSNTMRDDGALYNPQGQLVSYWYDPNNQVDPMPTDTPTP